MARIGGEEKCRWEEVDTIGVNVGLGELGNESSGCIKLGEFLDQLS